MLALAIVSLFSLTAISEAQDDPEKRSIHTHKKKIGSAWYISIDEWNDIPIFFLTLPSIHAKGFEEIIVWEDGRIAWRDLKKESALMYYKSHIDPQNIRATIEKLIDLQKTKTRFNRTNKTFHSMYLVSAAPDVGMTLSTSFFKNDFWSGMFQQYTKHRDEFQTNKKEKLVNLINLIDEEYNYFNCNPCRFSISLRGVYHKQAAQLVDRKSAFSDDEKYGYALEYRAEAEYFYQFKELVFGLIPEDKDLSSQVSMTKIFHVEVYVDINSNESGRKTYIYKQIENASRDFE